MLRRLSVMTVITTVMVAACGGGGNAEVEQLADACATTSNLGAEVCTCIANKAKEDLTEDGFDMLLAMLNDDQKLTAELRERLAMEDVVAAGMFMTSAPSQCASEMENS